MDKRVYTRIMSSTCHCILLRKAARRTTAIYDEALAPMGISVAQFSLLRNIARREPVSLTVLGTVLDLDRSTVGRNVKLLVRRGLVATGTSDDDLREATASLTDAGRAILRDAEPAWSAAQARIEDALGADGTAALHRLLDGF